VAAFDYCTAAEAFAYGGSAGTGTDPVSEADVMAEVVTAASRAIDTACHQVFYEETYSGQRVRARVDRDGVLTIPVPVPVVSSVTAVSYRVGASLELVAADLSSIDIEEQPHGSTVRLLSTGLLAARSPARVVAEISYTGGYANLAALPADLRWAARAVAWYEYQRRSAPLDKTAMPSMGIVVIPGDWPKHITAKLKHYTRVVAS
jgi:hypothetical protein